MKELDLRHTQVFTRNLNAKTKIVVNQGGSGSSKTWSLAQLFIFLMMRSENKIFAIVGKTLPALKSTAVKDFFTVLKQMNLYVDANHNKSDRVYKFGSNELEYFSADQPHKLKGRKRDYVWMSEADAFGWEDFIQIIIRTNVRAYLDYNPSHEFHWIYERVLTRDDCTYIHSTYKDNSFLEPERVREIELLQSADENFWKVYGLGERGQNKAQVYNHFKEYKQLPSNVNEISYGLDFGFTHPTALIEIAWVDGAAYCRELIYESKLTTDDLIKLMKEVIPNKRKNIWADSAAPNAIEEIFRAGFNIKPAAKDVSEGIKAVKSTDVFIESTSVNLIKEGRNYKWKEDKTGRTLEEPVKFMDDAVDALRYNIYNQRKIMRVAPRAKFTFS